MLWLPAALALPVVREQLGRPDLGVEDDVVLAHEVVRERLGVVPPLAPPLRLTRAPGPLDARRQVADHRVEPHVQPLGGLLAPPLERDRDAPVDVAGHGPRADVLQDVLAELDDVRPPQPRGLALVEPGAERLRQRRQVEEEVLGLDEARRLAVDLAARVDEVRRVELVAAVVALVAARARKVADGAFAGDIAVGQKARVVLAVELLFGRLVEILVLQQAQKEILRDRPVIFRIGVRKQIVADADFLLRPHKTPVIMFEHLPRRDAAFVGLDWADEKHAVVLLAADSQIKEHTTLEHTPEALSDWVTQLQQRFPGGKIAIILEQSRGSLLYALLPHAHLVLYPINPQMAAKFRKAFYPSGSKTDPLDADLLLMDEPLSALDALTREDLQDLLLELWRQRGHTAVLVTHSIEEAVFLGRRIIVMTPRPGRVHAIVENPRMGESGYRATEEFYERCAELRRLLAEEGALQGALPAAAAGAKSPL